MQRFKQAFLLSLASLAVPTIANANAQASLLAKLDVDQDGFISLKEAVSNTELLRNFSKIDANEDGLLSADELAQSKVAQSLASDA